MKFSDIIGQQELKEHLVRGVQRGRISHAQLFSGAAGTGGLPLALAYAQYINCPHRTEHDSCGVCPSCVKFAALAHPDLHIVLPVNKQKKKSGEVVLSEQFLPLFRELMGRTGGYLTPSEWRESLNLGKTLEPLITAKEADEIVRRLSFKSFEAEYKVMVIWLPERMNEDAANKILKILEEPWERTLFLLVSERPDLLLPTILSRTQEVAVPRLRDEELMPLAEGLEELQRANMVRLAAGDVVEMRRLVSGEEDGLRRESFERFCSLMRLSYNDKHLELIDWADEVAMQPRDVQLALLSHSARLLRESYMLHAGLGKISYLWGEEAKFCNNFAPFIGNHNVESIVEQIESARRQLTQNANAKIVFTHFALAVSKMIRRLK